MMRKFINTCLLIVSSFLLVSCFSSSQTTSSQWKVDFSDIAPTLSDGFITFPRTNVIIKTYNNSDALCIYIRFNDLHDQFFVLQNGMTIWVDIKSHKKENFGIMFPAVAAGIPGTPELEIKEMTDNMDRQGAKMIRNDKDSTIIRNLAHVTIDGNKNLNFVLTMPLSEIHLQGLVGKTVSIGIDSENKTPKSQKMKYDESENEIESNEMHNKYNQGGMRNQSENIDIQEESYNRMKGWIRVSLAIGPY